MINLNEIVNGEDWELFARDFLVEMGFYVESSPDRGADGGKDLLITEELKGQLDKYRFRWLVSCKNYATSNKSVTESDEQNILERIKHFKADGFIGFYSTIVSSALHNRLQSLKENREIKDFKIFDGKLIESQLISIGFSEILQRYLPDSYKEVKPLQNVLETYTPINCEYCGKDLLFSMFEENYSANLIVVNERKDGKNHIEKIYCACKGKCDRILEDKYSKTGKLASWNDLSDLIIPEEFLRYLMAVLNRIKDGDDIYTNEAFEQQKEFIIALSQKVFRATTKSEKQRSNDLGKIRF